jgi:cyclopropane fatty-acyl-phospholipid synthase-like methyltransferase
VPDTLSNLSRLRKRYALAELKPSQTVLDFGSGGGIALIFTFQANLRRALALQQGRGNPSMVLQSYYP